MDRKEVIRRAEELKESLRLAHSYDQSFYEELLDEYSVQVWALRFAKDEYPWEQVLELQEQYDTLEARLPSTSDEEFDEYVVLGDLLAVLLYPIEEVKNVAT